MMYGNKWLMFLKLNFHRTKCCNIFNRFHRAEPINYLFLQVVVNILVLKTWLSYCVIDAVVCCETIFF